MKIHWPFFKGELGNDIRIRIFLPPPNALAECLLAGVHLHMYRYNGDMTPSRLDQARRAAETVLQLAPKLPQSHLATVQYYYFGPRDYERALRELTATPSATADRAEFVDLAALTERRLGHWKDAIRDGERAAELDPQNPFILNELVESYISVRRFPYAERLADKGIKAMVTQNGHLAGLKSQALLGMGRIKEAGAVPENSPWDMTRLYHSVMVAMFARDFARAFRLLENATPAEPPERGHPFSSCAIAWPQNYASAPTTQS